MSITSNIRPWHEPLSSTLIMLRSPHIVFGLKNTSDIQWTTTWHSKKTGGLGQCFSFSKKVLSISMLVFGGCISQNGGSICFFLFEINYPWGFWRNSPKSSLRFCQKNPRREIQWSNENKDLASCFDQASPSLRPHCDSLSLDPWRWELGGLERAQACTDGYWVEC